MDTFSPPHTQTRGGLPPRRVADREGNVSSYVYNAQLVLSSRNQEMKGKDRNITFEKS
jgi:hypothetical protein